MVIHLKQLGFYQWAVDAVSMAYVVQAQVMGYQHIPIFCLCNAWQQLLWYNIQHTVLQLSVLLKATMGSTPQLVQSQKVVHTLQSKLLQHAAGGPLS